MVCTLASGCSYRFRDPHFGQYASHHTRIPKKAVVSAPEAVVEAVHFHGSSLTTTQNTRTRRHLLTIWIPTGFIHLM